MDNIEHTLESQIAAKVAAYQVSNKKTQKANFGLPVADVDYCFIVKQRVLLKEQCMFDNVPAHW